jgi:hypothetical protein
LAFVFLCFCAFGFGHVQRLEFFFLERVLVHISFTPFLEAGGSRRMR